MNITIIGTGYVGLVTGVCLSNVGNKVICLDIDDKKVDTLSKGISPIYEPGLGSKLKSGLESGNLRFSSDSKDAIESSDLIFIAVGTPSLSNGKTDLSYIKSASNSIAENLNSDKIVITKSTVPVGTSDIVRGIISQYLDDNSLDYKIDIISNPEFLKEGKAIKDFESPDRIVLGYDNKEALNIMKELYRPFSLNHDKIISMDIRSAELTKYAANAMLATKISFINEMANISEKVGANINDVRKGIGTDSRIGFDFIYPGLGFGGSCFPKDLKSIQDFSKDMGYNAKIINAVIDVNRRQRELFADKIVRVLKPAKDQNVQLKVGIWGLSFKPQTDDIREAPSIDIVNRLLEDNFLVSVFDPIAMSNFKKLICHKNISFCDNMYDVLIDSDAIVLCTEWNEFRSPDFSRMKSLMNNHVIFDGKNIYNSAILAKYGFKHFQVGVKT